MRAWTSRAGRAPMSETSKCAPAATLSGEAFANGPLSTRPAACPLGRTQREVTSICGSQRVTLAAPGDAPCSQRRAELGAQLLPRSAAVAGVDDPHVADVSVGVDGDLEDRATVRGRVARARELLRDGHEWARDVEAEIVIAGVERVAYRLLDAWRHVLGLFGRGRHVGAMAGRRAEKAVTPREPERLVGKPARRARRKREGACRRRGRRHRFGRNALRPGRARSATDRRSQSGGNVRSTRGPRLFRRRCHGVG